LGGTHARMIDKPRVQLIGHAAILLLFALAAGFPAVVDADPLGRLHTWRSAHLALLVIGIWILATAAVMPSLVLPRREATALVWSLAVTGYGIGTAVLLEAGAGVNGHGPGGGMANWVAFLGNTIGALAALLAVLLTLTGAWAALRSAERS
jgi:hypothetical protein